MALLKLCHSVPGFVLSSADSTKHFASILKADPPLQFGLT